MTRKRAGKVDSRSETGPAVEPVSARAASSRDEVARLQARNDALEKANAELQCLDDYRSQFLARLSHELRNPLTSILGFTEILLHHETLTTAQEDFCRRIQNSALQMESNLNQLADLARLEFGYTSVSLEEFSLTDALRQSCAVLTREAQKHNVQLQWRASTELAGIVSDRSKVRQVLYNFLDYAISRSPEGAVVNATLEEFGPNFVLNIEDEGERLPGSAQLRVANPPLRADRKVANHELGLAIARRLIEVLGAKLSIQNREPCGVVTTIQFPARPSQSEAS